MRILVVEDVHSLADDIAEGLRDEGFAVDVAYDGLDAAAKLDTNAYQVVVLDRDLPGIDGDTLCRMITESDRPAMTLMLTAAGTSDDRISGLSLGADDYLTKPFHFTELVLRIRALARRQPTARPRIYHAAGLTLDPQRHTATRDGRPLGLSVKTSMWAAAKAGSGVSWLPLVTASWAATRRSPWSRRQLTRPGPALAWLLTRRCCRYEMARPTW